jgi:hypothetical protein
MLAKAGSVRIRLVSRFEQAGQSVAEHGLTVALALVAVVATMSGFALAVSGA